MFAPEELAGVLAATSISFDLSIFELFVTLAWGGKVVLAANALELPHLALASEVVLINTVPSALAELVRQRAVPESVRTINLAGEPLKRGLVEAIYQSSAVSRVLDLYGPSETTTYSTWAPAPCGELREPTIGRPIAGSRAVLLGRSRELVPAGVPGEICLGGAGLARGYLNRPDLTAERFVPDPFSPEEGGEPGGRLYRTGDLARYLPDGRLDYLGRIDAQIKVRGFRVEPGEIEEALADHPRVCEAIVLPRETPSGVGLVAYVVAAEEAPEPSELREALREFLRQRLPAFMVPSGYVFLRSLPLTANGKVDRKALAKLVPERVAPTDARAEGMPLSLTQELVAGIFAGVLGLERVGLEESFFELGGHSLLATQVVSRLREAFGVELPLRELFAAPTVGELAGTVEALRAAGPVLPAPPLVRVARDEPLPLSFAQERLWFLDQLEPGGSSYGVPAAVRVSGALDGRIFAAALGEIVRRHEALRTTFASVLGRPVQVVAPSLPLAVPVVDLRALPGDLREATAQGLARGEAARSFDLAGGPLVRVALVPLSAEDHLALLTLHHIVSDGWSMGVLLRELTVLYQAFSAGLPSPLPELPIQYADFAVWQRGWLVGDALEARLAYWRQRLAGTPALLELPTDRPRPAVQGFQGGRWGLSLPVERLEELHRLSRRHGVTLFMTLLAAFDVLLHRYAGVEDVVVGSPIANRNRVETEPLIGFFVNTLVLRADLSEDPGFQRLLVQVREATLEAYAQQDLPFEKLVEEIAPQRSLSYTPIFQVVFVLQNAPLGSLELPGLRLEPVPVETGQVKFDLTLSLAESDAGAAGSFEYRTELFDAATIARLAAQWPVLLEGLAADPDLAVGDLPLMPTAERHQVLSMGTATAYPREACIHELFAAQAAERPEAVALVWDAGTVTYGELDRWSNRIAHRLRDLGVGPESLVGVLLERGAELVAVLLGILKAGGAYLPLDPTYPLERLERLAAAAGVLVARGPAAVALAGGRQVVDLGQAEALARCPDSALNVPVCADGLAYVMFTSGTTGVPKGIAVPHRGVVRLVRETSYAWFGPEEVYLQMVPISFDVSTFEVWGALLHGARVALLAERTPSLAELGRGLERHGVTTLWLTSGLFHQVVDTCPWILRGLRQLLAGGDALSLPHVRRALAELPGVRLINGYGPTEGTTFTCCAELSAASCRFSVPIGRPIANTWIYLVDRRGRAVPVGAPGELWIGGDGLARGYLGRADLTAERFVPDVFGGSGERLYRTGDLVRCRADGEIEFLGRIDQQVKVRGFRIEPGEIEAALLRSPAVEQAVVTVREDRSGDKRLVAYLVFRPGEALSAGSLRDLLAAQLPPYMVPAAFVDLDHLPLTPNGKVDRKALPAPEVARGGAELVVPRTPAEELVAGVFAEVLGLERVGLEESFFELGGHSLLATQVVSRLREAFGVELPLRELFAAPTVTELAAKVEALRAAGPVLPAPPLVRQDRATALPLSFAQERLWFLDQLEPGGSTYGVPAAVRVSGALDGRIFAAALGEIVRRHEALRTTFASVLGRPVQVVAPSLPLAVPVVDLRALPGDLREATAQGLARGEAARSFDLAGGPLVRVALVPLSVEDHLALLTLHHIVSDGWSMGVLLRELTVLYQAFSAGLPSPLPELPIQYADFAVWQRGWLVGDALEAQLAYWRQRLAGTPALLELPTDRPRPAVQSFQGGALAVVAAGGAARGAPSAEPASRCHPVHDAAGGVRRPAAPVRRGRRTWWWARRSPIATGWRRRR